MITVEWIRSAAELIGSLGVGAGVLFSVFRLVERDKKQSENIRLIQKEQTLLCYGVLACLKGLAEQGCDGPVHEAREKIEKHLNRAAHGEDAA